MFFYLYYNYAGDSMRRVKYNGEYIQVDDSEFDEIESGVIIPKDNELEKTKEFKPITDEDILSNTQTDLWGDKNE